MNIPLKLKKRTFYLLIFFGCLVSFFFYFNISDGNERCVTDNFGATTCMVRYVNNALLSNDLLINGIELFKDVKVELLENRLYRIDTKIVPNLGDDGKPVYEVNGLTKRAVDWAMKIHSVNTLLSDRISFNRTIPDARNPLCKEIEYDELLLNASVVIIFYNEPWSMLIRTIHSVISRSSPNHLKEIILVDDASDQADLKDLFPYYVMTRLPKFVKFYRLRKRSGLIRAKLYGAGLATYDVIIFLDAHCEVGINWLEPMLHRIKQNRTVVVMPVIDVINATNLGYTYDDKSYQFSVGSFTWYGTFTWTNISQRVLTQRQSPTDPTMSPTMAGGIFAIDRKYFWEIGAYDPQMEIWGGENLEMSFRVWQCGGSLEVLPCSRVGHVFRSARFFETRVKIDTLGFNTVRAAEVWMDGYKRLLYMYRPHWKNIYPNDLTERVKLRKQLHCKDFSWYLTHVFPEKFIIDEHSIHWGKVRLKSTTKCIDTFHQPETMPFNLTATTCDSISPMCQIFSFSKKSELRREEWCAEVIKTEITMFRCSGSALQKWNYTENGYLQNVATGLCASFYPANTAGNLIAKPCRIRSVHFMEWQWEYSVINGTVNRRQI